MAAIYHQRQNVPRLKTSIWYLERSWYGNKTVVAWRFSSVDWRTEINGNQQARRKGWYTHRAINCRIIIPFTCSSPCDYVSWCIVHITLHMYLTRSTITPQEHFIQTLNSQKTKTFIFRTRPPVRYMTIWFKLPVFSFLKACWAFMSLKKSAII